MKALEMTIEELDLSVRSFNCLKRAGINTVEDLSLIHIYRTRGKLAEIKFCPSIEETTAEVMKALEA